MANVGKSGESARHGLANVGESGESDTFLKKAILASTRICQKWRIFGEYSNSTNSLSSGYCLKISQILLYFYRRRFPLRYMTSLVYAASDNNGWNRLLWELDVKIQHGLWKSQKIDNINEKIIVWSQLYLNWLKKRGSTAANFYGLLPKLQFQIAIAKNYNCPNFFSLFWADLLLQLSSNSQNHNCQKFLTSFYLNFFVKNLRVKNVHIVSSF